MARKMIGSAVLAAVSAALLFAGPAGAKVLKGEDFTLESVGKTHPKSVKTPRGRGWKSSLGGDTYGRADYLEYLPADALNPDGGTIELDIIRDNADGSRENLFTIIDASGKTLLTVDIVWKPPKRYSTPLLYINGRLGMLWYSLYPPDPKRGEIQSRQDWIPLPSKVSQGERLHLAFTWSRSDGSIWIDGRDLKAGIEKPFLMSQYVREAERFTVGGQPRHDGSAGAYSQMTSLMTAFHTYDEPLDGRDLYRNPERYRTGGGQPAIASLDHDGARVAGFSGKLVAGDTVTVAMEGTAGMTASFDVARLADRRGEISLSWKGWGVYLEEKVFFDDDEINLRDVDEYRVYASANPIDLGAVTVESPFVEVLDVEEQSYVLSEVIVPVGGGEFTTEFLQSDTPYYVAVMALMDDGSFRPVIVPRQNLPMPEIADAPGSYGGSFTVEFKDVYGEAVVVARMEGGGTSAMAVSEETFVIDARLNLDLQVSVEEMKADEKSTSEITVTVTDANGDEVPDHEIRFLLATTSQYTGVVGGGAFTEEVGGSLKRDFRGVTDMFGRATATYTAGFAAKTAIIVARDMVSDDTGAGYIKTYIDATAQLELEAVTVSAGKALGYAIAVTSSDEWLTADGESEARITALVTKDGIPVEGHRVGFTVATGTGRIRTVKGETGSDGKARAIYTAGKKIGIVLIRATDHTVKISGTVQIELRSDAPAKIAITLSEEVLPADGRSTADVAVVVTDINDNPNEGIEVEYVVAIGDGRIRDIEGITNRDGESSAQYVAGKIPGRVSIEVTVRSTVPTEEELLAARDLATAVLDYDFY